MDSKTNYFDQIGKNQIRSLILILILGVFYIFIAYAFSYYIANEFITYGVTGYFLGFHMLPYPSEFSNFFNFSSQLNIELLAFSVVLIATYLLYSYRNAGNSVLRYNNAKEADKKEYSSLYNLVEGLAGSVQIHMPRLYIQQNDQPNAFATGLNKNSTSITVTTGLLSSMDKQELQGVLAHEVSHIANSDTQLMVVAMSFAGAMGLFTGLATVISYIEAAIVQVFVYMVEAVAMLTVEIVFFVLVIIALLLVAALGFSFVSGVLALPAVSSLISLAYHLIFASRASETAMIIIAAVMAVIVYRFRDIAGRIARIIEIALAAIFGIFVLVVSGQFINTNGGAPLFQWIAANPLIPVSIVLLVMAIYFLRNRIGNFVAKLLPLGFSILFSAIIVGALETYIVLASAANLSNTAVEAAFYGSLNAQNIVLLSVCAVIMAFVGYEVILPLLKYASGKELGFGLVIGAILSPFVFLMAAVVPLFMLITRMAVSRKREFIADANGARITRNPKALARALGKIKKYNDEITKNAERQGNVHLIARLVGDYRRSCMSMIYFNPASMDLRNWLSDLFSTHPRLEDRIKILENMH
jgi:Zn-dependent protease with chaperone function